MIGVEVDWREYKKDTMNEEETLKKILDDADIHWAKVKNEIEEAIPINIHEAKRKVESVLNAVASVRLEAWHDKYLL